jgi:AGZA family xanthine/uracil permease-like MFS transporter
MFRSGIPSVIGALEEGLPAFLMIVLIPLTFSITTGLLWGFLAHAVLFLLAGRAREVKPTMYALALLSMVLIYVEGGF